jgi:glutamyl-tRNA reductase
METHPAVLFLLGASHHTAPLAVREILALDEARAAALAARLQQIPGIRELTLLNTCNRVEVYGVASDQTALGTLHRTLCDVTGCPSALADQSLFLRHNHDAVSHLFAVASGLDSQILGETEILGQVKGAYESALEKKWTGPVLNRVFQKTFQAAKHIRTHTAIGEGQVSIATVAVDLAGKIFGDLAPVEILVVGAGEIGLKTAQAFQSRGAKSITVASRTLSKAEEAVATTGGWAASLSALPEILARADIVASSTSAPHAVLTAEMVAAAMKHRAGRPLFLVDLALPRDVEPACAGIPDVYLYTLDDLAKIAEENLARRQAETARCRAILADRTAALWPQLARSLARET